MTGDGDGLRRGRRRPPLPHRPRIAHRTSAQRERAAPDVDWGHSLQHFAAVVRDDLRELSARFVHENVVTFAAWKRLWTETRMSAAFLVEFWESTPTDVHKTILQQTLDEAVSLVDEHDGVFDTAAAVAALVGRVFAMYCAYSVQLGSPKHKIDTDPQDWTALLTIDCVMAGVGAALLPTGARQARAMLHRLVAHEHAFLRCLQGFGPRVRVKKRPARAAVDASRDVSLHDGAAMAKDALVDRSRVKQLSTLDKRYQDLVRRARAGPSVPNASAGLDARPANVVVSTSRLSKPLAQGAEHDGQELTRALTLYVEYKANEEARRRDRVARAAAVRDLDSKTSMLGPEDDGSATSDLSDQGSSIVPLPSSAMAVSLASSRRGSHRRHHSSGGSEDALAELESELHENILGGQVEPSRTQPPRKLKRGNSSSRLSEISEADSDALADLEDELEQSCGIVSSQTQRDELPGKAKTRTNRKRGRDRASAGIVLRNTKPTAVSTATSARARLTPKRPRSDSVASSLSIADSWTVSSIADSDGLAAIQAELDAVPTLPGSQKSKSTPRRLTDHQAPPVELRSSAVHDSTAKPKAKQVARQTADRASGRCTASVQPKKCELSSTNQRAKGKPRALSLLSDSSECKGQPEAEVDLTTSFCTSIADRPRRSSRLVSAASETGSDAIDELERELNASAATLTAIAPSPMPASTRQAPRKRAAVPSKRAGERTYTRSSAKKLRLREATTSVADGQPSSAQTFRATEGTQRAVPIARQGSSRISSVMSDTESDGLADLMAELDTIATVRTTSTRPRQEKDAHATSVNTRSTAREKSLVLPGPGVSHSGTARSVIPSSTVTPSDAVSPPRRSARLSSLAASDTESDGVGELPSDTASLLRRSARLSSLAASDTESDGVEDLIAELERGPAGNRVMTSTKKPKARVRATRRQSTRASGVKPRQNRAKKEPKAVRDPRVGTRQAAPRKSAAMLSTLEHPTAPRNLPSSRRSTRSSSVAFDSNSEDLAELEAELQAGYARR
ncbi:unnamed protein product [Hyaloperonospora brassicae]|uniref:Uncharacterized protein n=1 Tax=Hyaloperonospora brassicae TaxID=162125 RepID=A0AAV0TFF2_HYABA|nr:unnamed protein product [Hyaloperonospora brassicae]